MWLGASAKTSRALGLVLKWPGRTHRGGEQGRPEQQDQGRTTEGTNRPNGFGESTAPASEPQGELARAEGKRGERRDGDGGADRHGKGCRNPGPEHPLRQREDEHQDRTRTRPDADREHHGENSSRRERAGKLPRIDDVVAGLAFRVTMTMLMVMGIRIVMIMTVVIMVVFAVAVLVIVARLRLGRARRSASAGRWR